MKKNTKVLIACMGCVAVLGAALAVVMNLPNNQENTVTETSDNNALLLFDKTKYDAESITVKNSGGEYHLLGFDYLNGESSTESSAESSADESSESSDTSDNSSQTSSSSSQQSTEESSQADVNMIYTMQEYSKETVSKTMTDSLVRECNYMAATRIVDKSGKKYNEYGLEKPRATVTTEFSDGSAITLYIGNDAPSNMGVYLRQKGDKYVYLVQASMVDMFLVERLQMLDRTISTSFNTDYKVASIELSGTKYNETYRIANEMNGINLASYIMTSPRTESCHAQNVEDFGESVFGMSGTTVTAAEVSQKDLGKYGLDKPYINVSVKSTDNKSAAILVSKADKDKNCYVMKKGGTIVYQMSQSEIPWYEVQYSDLLDKSVFTPDTDYLISTEVAFNGSSYLYEYKRESVVNQKYEDTTVTTVYYGGTKINYENLSNFIYNVSGITRQGAVPTSLDGCTELLKVTYTFKVDDKESKVVFQVYNAKDNQKIVVLNDHIEGYTSSEYIEKLIKQPRYIPTDNEIEVINTLNNETSETSELSESEAS